MHLGKLVINRIVSVIGRGNVFLMSLKENGLEYENINKGDTFEYEHHFYKIKFIEAQQTLMSTPVIKDNIGLIVSKTSMNKLPFSQQIEHLFKQTVLPVHVPGIDIDLTIDDIRYSATKYVVVHGKQKTQVIDFIIREEQIYIIKITIN